MGENQELPQGQLMDIGTVAAHNIAKTLGLPSTAVEIVRDAIRDEISAMSSHFTMAVTDLSNQFEIQGNQFAADLKRIKSGYQYVRENKIAVASVGFALLVVGFLIGASI